MKTYFTIAALLFSAQLVMGQEICDNGLDDNGDGLTDLNDPSCACTGISFTGDVTSTIPNPSFESFSCCPSAEGQIACAEPWFNPNASSTSYYNTCGYVHPGVNLNGLGSFPDGSGVGAFGIGTAYREYVAVCLEEPLLPGNTYNISFSIAFWLLYPNPPYTCPAGNPPPPPSVELAIFAHPDCNPPSTSSTNCLNIPTSSEWEVIGSFTYSPQNFWLPLTITCNPNETYNSIAIGGACGAGLPIYTDCPNNGSSNYGFPWFLIDGLGMQASGVVDESVLNITANGDFCDDNLTLAAGIIPSNSFDISGGTWQWYYEGVAIPGQTNPQLLVAGSSFQPGTYTVRYQLNGECISKSINVQWNAPTPTTETQFICPGSSTICAGQSFAAPGAYEVVLNSPSGCDSVVTCNIELYPEPPPTERFYAGCAPFAVESCGEVFTESGIYEATCDSYLGCDSVVIIHLTVLEPLAVFLAPDTLSCDTTDQVQLVGALSPLPTNPAVQMTYEWTGPAGGLVGPTNGPAALARLEGNYCLNITYSQNGQSCTDTQCHTVSRIGGAPCLTMPPPDCVLENCCCGTPAEVSVPNGNFETPSIATNIVTFYTGDNFGGWNVVSGDVDLLGPNYLNWATGNPNGASQFIDLHGFNPGTISTTLTGMMPGSTYTIVIWYAKNAGAPSGTCNITVAGGSWLNESWTATNNGADGWLEICFSFVAQAPVATLQLAGSGPFNLGGMLLDDITMWGCPTDTEPPVAVNPPVPALLLECTEPLPPSSLLATDNCALDVSIDFSEITIPDFCFYTLERTWTLSDDCGNSATIEQTITVTDDEPPVLVMPPADLTVNCNANFLAAFDNWLATNGGALASDNRDNDLTWQATFSQPPTGDCGQTTVVFVVSDDCGNLLTAEAIFTIADNQPPTLTVPAQNISLPCSADPEAAFNDWLSSNGLAIAGDPCEPITWTNDYPGGAPSPINIVIFTATDQCGNSIETVGIFTIENTAVVTQVSSSTCNPAAAGVFTSTFTSQYGCDSIVVLTVAFSEGDTTLLSDTSCDPTATGVFTEIFTNQSGCDSIVVLTVAFSEGDTTLLSDTSCDPAETGVFTEIFTNQNGCDSIVVLTVAFSEGDTTLLSDTSCDPSETGVFTEIFTNQNGCDSVVVLTVAFSEGDTTLLSDTSCDPTATGVFTEIFTNQNGCDSVVVLTVAFSESDTTMLSETTCDPSAAGVFTEIFTNQNGCDSIVVLTVNFALTDTTMLSDTSCDPAETGVFTSTFTNQNGCDSIVVLTVNFALADTTLLSDTSCDPSETGVFTEIFTNQNGCDSVVVLTVAFSEGDTTLLSDTSCDPTATGVFTEIFTNQNGCDSVVVLTVAFSESDTTMLSETTCDPSAAGVFTEIFTNQNGCDSIVVLTVNFALTDTTMLSDTSCDPAETGVFTSTFTNQNGCDSIVVLTVNFALADTTLLSDTSCDPSETGVFTEIFTNQSGCDSIVVLTVNFALADTTLLSDTSCDPAETGVFTSIYTNQSGCDSIVVLTVAFSESDTTLLSDTSCNPSETGVFTEIFTNQNGCDSIVVLTVAFSEGDTTLLSDTSCDPSAAGVFTEIFTNQNGCDSIVVLTVAFSEGDTTLLSGTSCNPAETGVLTEIFTNQNGCDSVVVLTVAFSESDTTMLSETTCDPSAAGVFTEIFTNQNGCDSIVVTEVLWSSPTLTLSTTDFSGFGVSCYGGQNGAINATATGAAPFLYLWSNGEISPVLAGLPAGIYALTVTDVNGCTTTTQAELTQPAGLELTFLVNHPDCFDASTGTITAQPSGGVQPYLFAIGGGELQGESSFTGLQAGIFEVWVQDGNGCETSDIISVNTPLPVDVELGENQQIVLGETATLNAIVNLPFDSLASVTWEPLDLEGCTDCLSQLVAPLITTAYMVTVVDVNGCQDSDGITVFVERRRQVYVPNAFSPNGDGLNDLLTIYALPNSVKTVRSFLIFSRWGESVFELFEFQPNDPTLGWDGTHQGQPLNPAVFVWFAELEFLDGAVEIMKGDVHLLR